jgi:NAD(P)-dependent dehydrogenase (short-subunit alcohol dehydrogenase family)
VTLEQTTAIVTGSTKGIGRGLADALAQVGANIVVVSRSQRDCERVAAEIAEAYRVDTLAWSTDVTDATGIAGLISKTVDRFGRIDVMVNNAGSAITKKAEELTEADWDRVINVDLKAVFFCAQAAGKVMIEQKAGKIINIASIFGLVGDKQVLPYCVAKGGVVQMTRALALEWAKHNIQVNALCPGYVVTPMNEADLMDERISSHILRKIAMRRYGQVSDMTGACVFLASEESRYMTGQTLVVDGGWTCE